MTRTVAAVLSIFISVGAIDAQQSRDGATRPASAPVGTSALSGTIVTDEGKPVRRAVVRLAGSDTPTPRLGVTDDAGRFAFARLPAGSFTISATRAGYVTTYYGSKRPGRGPALPIALAAGQRSSVSMTMLRGAAIAGVITNQLGRPAPQVTVQVTMPGVPLPPRTPDATPTYTTTDDRGMFRIFGLAPGAYVVSAIPRVGTVGEARASTDDEVQWALQQLGKGPGAGAASGAAPPTAGRSIAYAPVLFPGTTDPDAATKIVLGAGEERSGVAFALQFVATARIDGTVAGPGGRPASNLMVMLLPKSAGSAPSLQAMVEAGLAVVPRVPVSTDGRFSVGGVTPGQYVVAARTNADAPIRGAGPGTGTLWGEADVSVDGRDIADVAVTLHEGAKLTGTLAFEGSSLPPPADASVVRVSLSPNRYGATTLVGTPFADVTAAGAFVFPSLMSGTYAITVTPPLAPAGAKRWTLKSVVAGGRDVTDGAIEVRTGEDLNGAVVTFTDRETEISGTVVDAARLPSSQFSIVVFTTNRDFWTAGSRRVHSVRPATDGTFRIAGLPAGEYSIVAVADLEPGALSDPGYLEQLQPAAFKITLAEGEKKQQDFRIGGGD